jgi:FkbM family methyltransferase
MSLRNGVKQLLKMCGHAFVGTVHDHLNDVDRQLSQITSQLGELKAAADSLAEAGGALLQGGIRTLEELRDVQIEFRRQDAEAKQRLDEAEVRWSKLLGAWQSIREQNGHLIETVEDRLARSHQTLFDAMAQFQNHLRPVLEKQTEAVTRVQSQLADTSAVFENELVRQVCVETGEYGLTNPETGLFSFLYSYLPDRGALDIGANHGSVSELLLKAGFEVYAFEPQPEVYDKLVRRLGNSKGFHAFPLALGSRDGEMPLHLATDVSAGKTYEDASVYSSLKRHPMPADLPFTEARTVMVRTLAGLHGTGTLPQDIGLVKIDTEGYDLEVVRGMGERRYPVVAAEFWDSEIPFGGSDQLYTLDSLVGEMRRRDYCWHIVLYRIWGQNQSGFYCNRDKSIPKTWGNVIFFRDYGIFAQAQSWCSAVLPRTYFKPAAQA